MTTSDYRNPPAATRWVGWIALAAVMLWLVGSFQALMGFVALFNPDFYATRTSDLALDLGYTAWGWTHLVLGGLAVVAGFGILLGAMWARVYAICLAFLSAVANLAFLGAYPVYSIIIITFDVLAIYAIAVHGDEVHST